MGKRRRDPSYKASPELSAIIAALGRAKGVFTPREIAELTGLGEAYVARFLRGEEDNPQVSTVERIAACLGKTLTLSLDHVPPGCTYLVLSGGEEGAKYIESHHRDRQAAIDALNTQPNPQYYEICQYPDVGEPEDLPLAVATATVERYHPTPMFMLSGTLLECQEWISDLAKLYQFSKNYGDKKQYMWVSNALKADGQVSSVRDVEAAYQIRPTRMKYAVSDH